MRARPWRRAARVMAAMPAAKASRPPATLRPRVVRAMPLSTAAFGVLSGRAAGGAAGLSRTARGWNPRPRRLGRSAPAWAQPRPGDSRGRGDEREDDGPRLAIA